jgi:hypothetical protein
MPSFKKNATINIKKYKYKYIDLSRNCIEKFKKAHSVELNKNSKFIKKYSNNIELKKDTQY